LELEKMQKRRTDTGILGLIKRSNLREYSTLQDEVHRLKNENQQLKENITSLLHTIKILNLKVDNS
jgi:predicted  nucleic acid-binding Zn-ribbon protein